MNAVDDFRAALRDAGIEPPEQIIADGSLHRISGNGKRSDRSAWYVLHANGTPAGAFGDWRTGVSAKWSAKKNVSHVRQRTRNKVISTTAPKIDDHTTAARKAWSTWATATEADPAHPYLVKKGIEPHGIRQAGDVLMVPMMDEFGRLHSLQRIDERGNKRFFKGGCVAGKHYLIGEVGDRLLLCEGFATGATLREATGLAVAVCFSASNLEPAGYALRRKYPSQRFTYCGDNDHATAGNPGLVAARKAVKAIGDDLMVPQFESAGTDWNDYAALYGNAAIVEVLR